MRAHVSVCATVLLLSALGISCTEVHIYELADNEAPDPGDASTWGDQQDAHTGDGRREDVEADGGASEVVTTHVRPEECRSLDFFEAVPLTEESTACVTHDDCIRREASCCPVCEASNLISINKTDGVKRFWACCPAIGGPYTQTCDGPGYEPMLYASCLDGRCTLVDFSPR